jgi:hypothetical protein
MEEKMFLETEVMSEESSLEFLILSRSSACILSIKEE